MKKNPKAKIILNIIWIILFIITIICMFLDFPHQELLITVLLIISYLTAIFNGTYQKNNNLQTINNPQYISRSNISISWSYISTDLILLVAIIAVFSFHVPHATTISVFIIIIAILGNYLISKVNNK